MPEAQGIMINMELLNDMKLISADDENISYMGRTEYTDKKAVKFVFAGTSATLRFKGTQISAVIFNHRFYNIMELGVIIDGREDKVRFDTDYEKFTLLLAEGLEYGEHE